MYPAVKPSLDSVKFRVSGIDWLNFFEITCKNWTFFPKVRILNSKKLCLSVDFLDREDGVAAIGYNVFCFQNLRSFYHPLFNMNYVSNFKLFKLILFRFFQLHVMNAQCSWL